VRWPAKHTGSRRRTGTTRGTRTGDASYSYDALDRTAQETEHHPAANLTRTTTFTYEGLTSLVTKEVQQNTGGTTSTDTKTYNYDTYGHRISLNDTLVSGGTTTPTSYTYGYDVHGDVSLLVDQSNGSVKASYGYTPYGDSDTTRSKGDTNVNAPFNPYRYTGKRYDSGSQTLDMGARRFDTSAQRFLQMDQYQGALADLGLSSDPLTQNRYGLAASNPLNAVEYGGHRPACLDQGSCTFTPSPNGSGSGTSHSTMGPTIAVRPDPGDVSMFFKLIAHCYTDDLAALESCSVLDRNDCYSSPEMQAAYNAATEQWLTMIASGQLVENSKCNCYTLGRHGLPALQYDIAEGGALVIIPISAGRAAWAAAKARARVAVPQKHLPVAGLSSVCSRPVAESSPSGHFATSTRRVEQNTSLTRRLAPSPWDAQPRAPGWREVPMSNWRRASGADPATVVGGTLTRGANGEFFTTEQSGHFWRNWTPGIRKQFVSTMQGYSLDVVH
jgi:RHS repeat-associated protein